MLSFIRKHSGSWFVKLFLGMIAFTFLFFFGMSDVIRRYIGKDYVIKVGDVKIGPNLLKFEVQKRSNQLKKMNINDENVILGIVINQIIDELLTEQIATFSGISVNDKLIQTYIRSISDFVDKSGNLKKREIMNLMANMGLPEEDFVNFIKRNIKNSIISGTLSHVLPSCIAPFYITANLETRNVKYVEISKDNVLNVVKKPTEEDLRDFYEKNGDLFKLPEYRDFTVLMIDETELIDTIDISENEIKKEYDNSNETDDLQVVHDKIRNALVTEAVENKIDDMKRGIEDDLTAGVSCKDVAKEYNLKISEFRKINKDYVTPSGYKESELPFMNKLTEVAFALDEGLDSSFACALDKKKHRVHWILHSEKIFPERVDSFVNVKDKVGTEYMKSSRNKAMLDMASNYVSQINDGLALGSVAKGFSVKKINNLSRDTQLSDEKLKDIKMDKAALDLIANTDVLKSGYFSLGDKYIVFQVVGIKTPDDVNKEKVEELGRNLSKELNNDLYTEMKRYFAEKFGIKINKDLLKHGNEQIPDIDF